MILHVQTGDFLFFFPGRKGKDELLMTLQWNLSAISSTEVQDAIAHVREQPNTNYKLLKRINSHSKYQNWQNTLGFITTSNYHYHYINMIFIDLLQKIAQDLIKKNTFFVVILLMEEILHQLVVYPTIYKV